MNLENIKAFMVVVEAGSITRASKELHLSQPALSSQINYLEKHFKTPLLNRTIRGVSLTPAGEVLYQEGKRLLSIFENIESKIEALTNSKKEVLKIAASNTIGGYSVPCTLYAFRERYPTYDIDLEVSGSMEVVDKVFAGEVKLGFIEGPITKEFRRKLSKQELSLKRIGQDYIVIVAPYKEPWISKDYITVEELKKHSLILKEKDSGIRKTLEKVFMNHNISLKDFDIALEINNISAIISAVSSDKGISFLPKVAVKNELKHKILKSLNFEEMKFPHTFTMVYNDREVEKGLARDFFNFVVSGEERFC